MRNSSGITMVSLVSTVIVIIILTSIATVASLQSYNQMKYETFKAELEEIQREVDKISSDFQLAKNNSNDSNYSYKTYFQSRNGGTSPKSLGEATSESGVNDIKTKYSLSDNAYTFYLDESGIKKYLGISGIEKSVLVDFSTKLVYSIEGCKDPDGNDDSKYYTLSEVGGGKTYLENSEASKSTSTGVTVANASKTVGKTKMQTVTLTLTRSGTGKNYEIKKAYYSKDNGATWIEANYLGDCKYSGTTVSFVIYEAGSYKFKIEDSSGKALESDVKSLTL